MSLQVLHGLTVVAVLICCGQPSNSNSLPSLVRIPQPPTKVNLDVNISITAGRSREPCPEIKDCDLTNPRTNQRNSRIIWGCHIMFGEMIWQVAIVKSEFPHTSIVCGGTIICPKYIMTAAHCSYHPSEPRKWRVDELTVVTGTEELGVGGLQDSKYKIEAFVDHPEYVHGRKDYDYSLYEMERPIELLDKLQMAAYLPTLDDRNSGFKPPRFAISGWGTMKRDTNCYPLELMAAQVEHMSDEFCKSVHKDWTERMICAGQKEAMDDACTGDGGGPLTWLDPKTDEVKLIGAVSIRERCGVPNEPGIYSEISMVLPWINDVTGRCNEATCKAGLCMTGKKLHWETKEMFYD